MNELLSSISSWLWGWPLIILLAGTHLILTLRLRIPQRYLLKAIRLSVSKDPDSKGDVSQFGALAMALSATIGTGNIIGVGTAIALGGPGAVLWCWITSLLAIATKYGEAVLAIKYRETTPEGKMLGGPMYALERGLADNSHGVMRWVWKVLAIAFAVFTALATLGIGTSVQSNAIVTALSSASFEINPHIIGGVLVIVAGAVMLGGVKSIARVCSALLPFMAVLYVVGCIIILVINGEYMWPTIKLICEAAIDPAAVGGGFAGGSVLIVARYGVARGLFSNESGMGSAPIVAAAARTRNPVRQALVSATGTFWDSVVICAITGLVIVSSIIAYPDITFEDGGELTKMAFSKIPYIGMPLLTFGLVTFAFSTILGWGYYGERAIEYLVRKTFKDDNSEQGRMREIRIYRKIRLIYRIMLLLAVYVGAIMSLNAVWDLADIFNGLMAIPNLLSLLFLSGVIVKETKKYLWDDNLDGNM